MSERDDQLRAALDEALRTTPSTGNTHKPGEEKWDHHPKPGERGHKYTYTCALCRNDMDALLPALVAAVGRVRDAELEQARAEVTRLTALVGQYADRAIANGQRAEAVEQERDEARAALERVRELHRPVEGLGYDSDEGGYGHIAQVCTSCGTADEYGVRWPCPTVRAIDAQAAEAAGEVQR